MCCHHADGSYNNVANGHDANGVLLGQAGEPNQLKVSTAYMACVLSNAVLSLT